MTRPPVLIGEAPSRTSSGEPLGGRSGRALSEMAGFDVPAVFECRNVFPQWPGPQANGKGSAFPLEEARKRAWAMKKGLVGRVIVFLGKRVAAAFGGRNPEHYKYGYWHPYVSGSQAMTVIVPHPSGVNWILNSPDARAWVGATLRLAMLTATREHAFGSIVIDPPWRFRNKGVHGAAESHYLTMSYREVLALGGPIGRLARPERSVLWLWTPTAVKNHAMDFMESWDFTYKTTIYWAKPRLGLGFWFRNNVEEVLVGVRGDVKPFHMTRQKTLVEAPIGRHSEKPEAVWEVINRAADRVGGGRLEMFSREPRSGWTVWGSAL